MNNAVHANPTLPSQGRCDVRLLLSAGLVKSLPHRIYHGPRLHPHPHPALVYLHGGHFVDGGPDDADPIARALAACATVIVAAYPLAPHSVFPDTMEACFSVLEWASRQARRLRVDPARLFIGGEQAGAALAAATAMMARDRLFDRQKSRRLTGQVLITPLLDPVQATPSLREAGHHPAREAWARYLTRIGDFNHPYASPLRSRRLVGLPPCLLVSSRADPLHDEAELYRTWLQNAGVPVHFHLEPDAKSASYPDMQRRTQARAQLVDSFLRA